MSRFLITIRATASTALTRREVMIFSLGVLLLGINDGVIQISLNNYLVDLFNVQALERGAIEFPRELPGFLTYFVISLLLFMPEARLAVVIGVIISLGTAGLGVLAMEGTQRSFALMLVFMPLTNSITLIHRLNCSTNSEDTQ